MRKLLLLSALLLPQLGLSHVFSKKELEKLNGILFPQADSLYATEIRSLEMSDSYPSVIKTMEVLLMIEGGSITLSLHTEGEEIHISHQFVGTADKSKIKVLNNIDFLLEMKKHFHTRSTSFQDSHDSDVMNMNSKAISQEASRFFKVMNAFVVIKDSVKDEDNFESFDLEGSLNFAFSTQSDLTQDTLKNFSNYLNSVLYDETYHKPEKFGFMLAVVMATYIQEWNLLSQKTPTPLESSSSLTLVKNPEEIL